MNGLTESPSCLQKLPIFQPILPKARNAAEADLMLTLQIAKFISEPHRLFQASPAALNLLGWFSTAALDEFRRAAIIHLGHRLLSASPSLDGAMVDERGCAFEWVVEAASKPGPPADFSALDPKQFASYVSQLCLDANELADEELEKLKTEFYYIN